MTKKIILIVLLAITASICNAQSKNPDDYNYEVQFLRTGVQGTELFKVYSYCKKEEECFELAKADAIKAILFKGIPGSGIVGPMVREVGAEDKFRDYFLEFFKKGGKYLNFVSISNDGSIAEEDRLRVGKKLKIGVILLVQKDNLRKELESAGIVKKLDAGF